MAGFAVYRSTPEATILERGARAVTVQTSAELDCAAIMDLRRMAGLTWQELDVALATARSGHEAAPSPMRRAEASTDRASAPPPADP